MFSYSLIINFLCLLRLVHGQKPQYSIALFQLGAIFETGSDDLAIAFHTAIERANIYERSFELLPIIVYVDTEDSFLMEKTACNLISEEGVIAIISPVSGGSDIIASIANTLDIPHLEYDWSPSEALDKKQHMAMTLNVHPDNLDLTRGLADIVQSFGWRSYTIAYESYTELQQLQDILQIGERNSNPTTMFQLADDFDYKPMLKSIKMSTDNCLILHCSTEKIVEVLKQAKELKMLGEYQSIFIPNLDTHTIDMPDILTVGANISTVRIMDPTDFHVKNIVHDWEEHEKREKRYFRVDPDRAKTNMILLNDAIWIFVKGLAELLQEEELQLPKVECRRNRSWPMGRRIIEFMKARSDEVATGRVDFNQYGQRSFFTLRFLGLTQIGFQELATWDPVNGLLAKESDDLSDKLLGQKMQNKTFIITSRIGAPFLMSREAEEGEILQGNARYEGYSMDLIDAIAKKLEFKYEFQLAPDGRYGSYNKDTKQWDGLVRQILDGNADLGICDLTMTSSRRTAVDFTPPFMTLGISILYAKPEVPPANYFSFLSPFSVDVWMYMATGFLAVSLLLFILARMAPADWENPHPCKEPEELENVWTMTNTTWLAIGSIMGQGCDLLPKAASTRLATGIWWFFALMMLNSYTANLAAFLTMSRMGSSIKSAEDLAAQTKIKYGAVVGGSTMGFFKHSNFTTYQRMWAAMDSNPTVFTKSNNEGAERVLKGKRLYAFLMESTTLEYIVERQCDLMQVGGWLDYKTYGIAMPFNSPYRKQISGAVLKLGEAGTLSALKRKWWKEMHGGGNCTVAEAASSSTPELKLVNVGGVFLVLGIGLLCSIVIGLVEFLWNLKTVAIEEKISLKEALKLETMFALKVWITTKPVRGSSENSSKSSSSSSSSSPSTHSKKSRRLSISHSMRSLKSSIHETMQTAVGAKMRKIGSMFSLKSMHSGKPEIEIEPPSEVDDKIDKEEKATQIEMENSQEHRHRHHHKQSHRNHLHPDDIEQDIQREPHRRDSKASGKAHFNV
ncbi:glutamate receptor ionotropic, kainate 2 isoform X1 [Glossina fuscipes]|uniref:Glutamate receptor ionotropic, kainate 2 isoform X1 n=2 Tax=Glossina fuscipes TaxID=7396 RepID=A0A8U0WF29_9MUSC|nr:glutamate receptor ionotropic, kainate 2 isoform X1 [Glossina fuscipes]